MKKNICFYWLFILVFFSCTEKKDLPEKRDFISIDFESSLVSELKFSQFVDTIEFIPLETTNENLIGEVNRIIYDDEKYYIRATRGMLNSNLFVFDKTGKYLWGLNKRGYGPGEYNDFKDFLLTKDRINVVSYFKFISYDKKGSFKEEYKLEQHVKEFLNIDDTTFLAFAKRTRVNNLMFFYIMNDEGKVENRFFKRKESEARANDYRTNWRGIVSWGDSYYMNYPYTDTIFKVRQEEVSPYYYVDYGNKKIPSDLFKPSDEPKIIEKKFSSLTDYFYINSFGLADHYVYVGSTNKVFQNFLTLYSRKTGRTFSSHRLVDDMYLKGNILPLTAKVIPHNSDNGDILWEVEPNYLIDGYRKYMSNLSEPRRAEFKEKYPDLVRICTSLKEDDNPVLLRIKVKEF